MFGMAGKKGRPQLADLLEMLRQQQGPMNPGPSQMPPGFDPNMPPPPNPNAMQQGPSTMPNGPTPNAMQPLPEHIRQMLLRRQLLGR
jgi:hypothetical protein